MGTTLTRIDASAAVVVGSLLSAAVVGLAIASAPAAGFGKALPFEDPAMVVVYSGPDRDAQLFISTGSKMPMASLSVKSPQGSTVVEATFPGTLGQADFRLDTPEPSLRELKRVYPAGIYRWSGSTVRGRPLAGTSRLTYGLLTPPTIVVPAANTKLPVSGATLRWKPVVDAHRIHLEIEQVRTAQLLTVDLPGHATRFTVPDGFFQPGRTYVLDVKAVGANDNLTVSDVEFRV